VAVRTIPSLCFREGEIMRSSDMQSQHGFQPVSTCDPTAGTKELEMVSAEVERQTVGTQQGSLEKPSDIEMGGKPSYAALDKDRNAAEVVDTTQSVPLRVWVVLLISCCGVLMASISTTALIIAFPTLIQDLDTSITTMMWILLVLLLVISATVGIAGKLGDVFGQAALYKFGYWMFTAGCLIAGFAQKKNQGQDLLGARVITGFGAAFLFTNSSAILTGAFAPYGKVGLSQGIFQLAVACGMVLGPGVGGGFAETNWRWIFWWNVPVGGVCATLALWVVEEKRPPAPKPLMEHVRRFDWIGAIFYPLGLTLILMALIQGVVPSYGLNKPGPLAGLIVGGVISLAIFIVNEFYAVDPLVPPEMLLKNKVFAITTLSGTLCAFARYSITYNMIFFLQGPKMKSPLDAGLALIPFGVGVMAAGFAAGALADRFGVRIMTVIGPLVTLLTCGVMSSFTERTTMADIGGVLFVSGLGIGIFGSPNNMSNMLSVQPLQRGAAAAIGMATMMVTSMLGIVLTFGLVLNSMTSAQLFQLFIYGGSDLSRHTIDKFLNALAIDYYVCLGVLALAAFACAFNDFQVPARSSPSLPPKDAGETIAVNNENDAIGEFRDGPSADDAISSSEGHQSGSLPLEVVQIGEEEV
jgi:MFS family permease